MFSALTIAKNNGSFQQGGQCLDRLIPQRASYLLPGRAAVLCRDVSCRQAGAWRESGAWTSQGQATERPQMTSGKSP